MSTEKRRKVGLRRTFGLALTLGMFSSEVTAAEPPEIPQSSDVTVLDAVVLSPVANTEPANAPEGASCPAAPTGCDPVSRVPNFLGDFVARPSLALVNQPRVSTLTTFGSVNTKTLTFLGLPVDVAGGIGKQNIFYAPFRPNGIAGPGGPYPIASNVTGFGVILPPIASILDENAELTGLIRAKFPGATFAGGTGLLEPPFPVVFDYLQTTAQTGTNTQTVPGLVSLVSLSNPSGGGMVGRNKYFDDGSPMPRDRVFFDYNGVADFNGPGRRFNVNRYVLGAEKTFLDGFGSVEVRVPVAGTVNSDQNGGQADVNHAELGNIGVLFKGVVVRNANCIVTAGLGVSMPTADDSRIVFAGQPVLEIRNQAWLLQPILAAAWAPNDRFYVQAGLQFDFDANGNPVNVRGPAGDFSQRGVLTDQNYLYASGAVGYWIYQADRGMLSGVSVQGELHYNRTLNDRDVVQTGSVLLTDLNSNVDVLNATAGVNFVLCDQSTLSLGVSFPVSGERQYDWSLLARLNVRFGARD